MLNRNSTISPAVFEKIFSEWKVFFENIAFSYINDRNAAEDIVTDVFLYLWEHRDEISSDDNLKGYIYMSVRTRCISWIRKQQSLLKAKGELSHRCRWRLESSLDALCNDESSACMFQKDIIKIFRETLDNMPEITRNVFLSSRDEQMTYQEIAAHYGISVRKVTYEMQAALRFLKSALKDYLVLIPVLLLVGSSGKNSATQPVQNSTDGPISCILYEDMP